MSKRTCAHCATSGAKNKCASCRLTYYCDRRCQKLHWKDHKEACAILSSATSDDGRDEVRAPTNSFDIFTDAQEMHALYPDTFDAPSAAELASIDVGSVVKVCAHQSERFWVEVTSVDDAADVVIGAVDNMLVGQHGFNCGDLIRFRKCHVYTISRRRNGQGCPMS